MSVFKKYMILILVGLGMQLNAAQVTITQEQLDQFKTDGLGRICILDTHYPKWTRAWAYYPDRNRTESVRIYPDLELMPVVNCTMRYYGGGKALKRVKNFIVRLGDPLSTAPLAFGREAYISRFLQACMGLLDDYTDPLDPKKPGHFFIDEYSRNFIMCLQVESHDEIRKLMAYFENKNVVPAQTKPLLILDVAQDQALEELDADECAFLDAYFTWDNFNTNSLLQTFIQANKGLMRSLERDVEDAKPKYIENMRESILRGLESMTGRFEFDKPQMWIILGTLLWYFKDPIFSGLRKIESVDGLMKALSMPWGIKHTTLVDVVAEQREMAGKQDEALAEHRVATGRLEQIRVAFQDFARSGAEASQAQVAAAAAQTEALRGQTEAFTALSGSLGGDGK